MSDGPAGLSAGGGGAFPRPEGGPGPRVLERLGETECLLLIGPGLWVGRLAYTGRFAPTVLPVLYKLHESRSSVVFHTLADTSPKRTCGPVSRTLSTRSPSRSTVRSGNPRRVGRVGRGGRRTMWTPRPSVPRSSDPWPEAGSEHLIRVQPTRISGGRRRGP